jgi:hypothetical protein
VPALSSIYACFKNNYSLFELVLRARGTVTFTLEGGSEQQASLQHHHRGTQLRPGQLQAPGQSRKYKKLRDKGMSELKKKN